MKSSIFYLIISYASYLMLFIFGMRSGLVYVDSILEGQMLVPPIVIGILTLLPLILARYEDARIYIIGTVLTVYLLLFAGTIPYPSLLPFSTIALASMIAFFLKSTGFNVRTASKLTAFVGIIIAMFALGSSIRIASGPPSYALAFGSIYDNVATGGVPLMFTDGVVLYTKLFVLSVSVPVVILFTSLSAVLTENYYLIISLMRSRGSLSVRKSLSSAVTVLSCQCEGITAYFPSAIATILFAAIIPLISESIIFILMTDLLLILFYIKGKRVSLLDSIWRMTESRGFALGMAISLVLVPVYTTFVVYLNLQSNLIVFSSVNILMFLYGIFVIFLINRMFPVKRTDSRLTTYLLVVISSVGMFIWYVPQLTYSTVFNPVIFSAMGVVSVLSGIMSGYIFKSHGESAKMVYFEYVTMMFSMLAIVIFYISAVSLTVIWPEFGMAQQISFSLLLWGLTLPFMWLSTNISLNSDVEGGAMKPLKIFSFTSRTET